MLVISPIPVNVGLSATTNEGEKFVQHCVKATFVYNPRINRIWIAIENHRFVDTPTTLKVLEQAKFKDVQHFLSFFRASFKQHDILMEFEAFILEFDSLNTLKLH